MEYPAQDQMNVQPCLPAEAERQTIFTGLEDKQLRFFKISYLILYLLTYFYSAVFFNYQTASFFPCNRSYIAKRSLNQEIGLSITADKKS